MASFVVSGWKPESAADKRAVQEQLERILSHSAFRNSRRCPSLLRYVVECALQSNCDHLKERTLGIEVFARNVDYDTNLDPVVRTTASEVRKRIAQYYHEPGHEDELRIDLPSGSYVPEFHLANGRRADLLLPDLPSTLVPAKLSRWKARKLRSAWQWIAVLCALTMISASLPMLRHWRSETAMNRFWEPVLAAPGAILICLGEPHLAVDATKLKPGAADMTVGEHTSSGDTVALSDAITLTRIAGLLSSAGKPYRPRSAGEATLTDLRQSSAVLIAGFDNPWTLRLTDSLRFHFTTDDNRFSRIEDRENPQQQSWFVDFASPYSKLTQDYGMVARFHDPNSGQIIVVAAGIGENGTLAAGEFLTDPKYLEELRLPNGKWEQKNIEVVVASQVIDGKSGPPRVEAAYFW